MGKVVPCGAFSRLEGGGGGSKEPLLRSLVVGKVILGGADEPGLDVEKDGVTPSCVSGGMMTFGAGGKGGNTLSCGVDKLFDWLAEGGGVACGNRFCSAGVN